MTSSSWLNAVETFFSTLTRRRIRRGSFHWIVDLIDFARPLSILRRQRCVGQVREVLDNLTWCAPAESFDPRPLRAS